MPTKTGLFFIIAVAFCYLASAVFEIAAYVHIAAVLLAMLGADLLWLRLTCYGIDCEFDVDDSATTGERIRIQFTARNSWPIPRYGTRLSVRFPPAGRPDRRESVSPGSLPARSTTFHFAFPRCRQRGSFTVGPATVTYFGPLGLFYKNSRTSGQKDCEVRPGTVPVGLMPGMYSGKGFSGSSQQNSKPGPGTEFYGIRPYVSGDSPRWIHWLSTLREQELMTRQFQSLQQKRAVVSLNCSTGLFGMRTSKEEFETAVTVAASLARSAFESGYEVGLLLIGADDGWTEPAPGLNNLRRILSRLASADQHSGRPSAEDFQMLNSRLDTVLYVTPTPDMISARVLRRMRSRERSISCFLVNQSGKTISRKGQRMSEVLQEAGISVQRIRETSDLRGRSPDSNRLSA
ncbi:MAG: DUF58 domain-containing protein [Candidatus Brocadiia bacterium]